MKRKLKYIFVLAFCFNILSITGGSCILFAQNIINADPSNYRTVLNTLQPGDTLILAPGVYNQNGLPVFSINGTPDNPIVITGPDEGAPPIILGTSGLNTLRIDDSSYLTISNLEIDSLSLGVDGVNFQGTSHHVTLDNLLIKGVGDQQATVAISSNRAPTWDITIRNCTIIGAGTGMYLTNSDGNEQFVNGLIEYNLIMDTIGYNIELKHQNPRPIIDGMPTEKSKTIIRHNVFSKANNSSITKARPNLLVGHFPLSGPGKDDVYEIYGNFFYQNPSGEPLFQGEGNVAFYNNILFNSVDPQGALPAILIRPHNDVPKMIRIFNNTVISRNGGISISGADTNFQQKVIGNAVFAGNPIQASDKQDNIVDLFEEAGKYLNNPMGTPHNGTLDMFPKEGMLTGILLDSGSFNTFTDWDKDFNGNHRSGVFRGGYAGEGQNPGWILKLSKKILETLPVDSTPPTVPQGLNANAESDNQINLSWQAANDPESGIKNYNIYRDGVKIGQSATTSFSDLGLNEVTTYNYEVTAVNDAILESVKSAAVSASTLADITPPTIIAVTANGDPTKVTVEFSESVEQVSAEDVSNYNINNNAISVASALLDSEHKTLTLNTSTHSEGITYTLIVNNIKDQAKTPNVISANTEEVYTFVDPLIISNLSVASSKQYEVVSDGINIGDIVYIDRDFVYSNIPDLLQGKPYIKTANDDKNSSGTDFLSFNVNKDATVIVCHDNRIITKPLWLTSFTDIGEDLISTDTTMSCFEKDFPAGTITLGGNEGGGESMYTVVVLGQGSSSTPPPDVTPPAPPTGLIIVK